MSSPSDDSGTTQVDERMLRGWPLPAPGNSKYSRGRIAIVGGSAQAPGAVGLAGVSALRVGAGRLSMIVPQDVAVPLAVAVPEAGILAFDGDELPRDAVDEIAGADAVLLGPGLTDPDVTVRLLRRVLEVIDADARLILDAFALGVLSRLAEEIEEWPAGLVLTPNREEAALLLDRDGEVDDDDIPAIAARYGAVVTCYGVISSADGSTWRIGADIPGLATSGSGDVLAGAILGLAARSEDAAQAAVWGTFLHSAAGERLVARVGSIGFLAREISEELPMMLEKVSGGAEGNSA
ncbi:MULTISPECIES: NAD(P)H-hydrate dehydratase [unclassified Leifsonia]|uniref:NAD(P)H-hydrate dehydratase n=1 Tax=unclassified Leifsonia TaxID=2663824 RepID=UPI0006F3010E|nr:MULTISPECIES: NAD(P)H-hydrate dehydratase [unclassified Leifsonia]KQX07622.1 hypothetical protein ASC59_07740 [Leifsonia sp. Root1293]KRA11904.1 hypothetical protein ASD61_07740 [Leifsonia sp. Root60]